MSIACHLSACQASRWSLKEQRCLSSFDHTVLGSWILTETITGRPAGGFPQWLCFWSIKTNKIKQNKTRLNTKYLRHLSQIRVPSMRINSSSVDCIQALGGGGGDFVYRTFVQGRTVLGAWWSWVTSSSVLSPLLPEVLTEGLSCSTHPLQTTPSLTNIEMPRVTHLQREANLKFKDAETRFSLYFLKYQKTRHSTLQNN